MNTFGHDDESGTTTRRRSLDRLTARKNINDTSMTSISGAGAPQDRAAWLASGWPRCSVVITLFGTLFQVQPEEVGVVVRLGKYVRTTEPGLRVKIPFVEEVFRIPVQRQLKEEFGFRTVEAGVRTTYSQADFNAEAMMLTGDLNVAVVEWIVRYRVADPYRTSSGCATSPIRSGR